MRPGKHIEPWRMGMNYQNLPASVFENFDVDWFCDIQNHGIAQARYRFLATPAVIHQFMKYGYAGPAIERMWKAVFRACVAFEIPLAPHHVHLAEEYGLVIPED